MRVLFTSVSGLGHVHPMVPLARALKDAGHDVRWATGAEAVARLEAAGIRVSAAGLSNPERFAEYRRRYPEARHLAPADVPDHMFPKLFGAISAPVMLGDLLALTEPRPDLLIHDAAEFAGPIVAASLGVPSITHSFGALVPPSRVTLASREVAALWASVGLDPRPYGGSYDRLYLDIYPPSMQSGDRSHVPLVQTLRPVAFDTGEGEQAGELPLPDGDEPLVYLTFGTVFASEEPFRAAVEAIAGLGVRLLVTVGPGGDPEFLGPQPPRVRVERYVAQTRVFPHCSVVVSHGGSGTFLAALARGLPQLCLPQAADQFLNAAACACSGAGLSFVPEAATPDRIAEAVAKLLSDRSFRTRAEQAASEIAAMPGPDEVAQRLERDYAL